jgi:hypothetical protein
MKRMLFWMIIFFGLPFSISAQNSQNKSVQGTIIYAGTTEEGSYLNLKSETGEEISFSINNPIAINGKALILYDPKRIPPPDTTSDVTPIVMAGSMDEGYYLNPELTNKKVKVIYKSVKVPYNDNDPTAIDYNKIINIELLSSTQSSTSSNTWMVILGSFKTQAEAVNSQKQLSIKYQLQTEVLNTNNCQKMTKNLFIVIGGKNLTNADAKHKLEKINGYKIDGYIKDAGLTK